MSDLISIVDLEVESRIGVSEEERTEPQRLLISLEMEVANFRGAAQADDLTKTVNYFQVAERVKAVVAERPRRLLETLIEELSALILEEFAVLRVRTKVKKFILRETRYVMVETLRGRAASP